MKFALYLIFDTVFLFFLCWCNVLRQRPWKHFESGGALTKRGTFVYTRIKRFYEVNEPNENCLKYGVSIYNVGNGLYRVFTTAKRAFSFQKKRAFIQEILFSFFKWGI